MIHQYLTMQNIEINQFSTAALYSTILVSHVPAHYFVTLPLDSNVTDHYFFCLFPSRCRASLRSITKTTTSKRTTTQTSSRRPVPSFASCLGCPKKRSWSIITPAATGRAKSHGRDGSTSASTTSASTPTYSEKKVGCRFFHIALFFMPALIISVDISKLGRHGQHSDFRIFQ